MERSAKNRIDKIAVDAGITSAAMLQLIIEHVELTEAGVPTWFQAEPYDEELSINTA